MANASNTLNGLIQLNDQNLADINVSNLLQDAPVLAALVAVQASNGTLHKYLKETVACGAGFRDVNAGVDNVASQDELVTRTLKILDATFARDKALAMGYSKGVAAYMEREAVRALRAAFFAAEKQIINGTGNAADGFEGLLDTLNDLDLSMVVNAGGTGSGTIKTSCYLIRSTESDVAVIAGNDGKIDVGEMAEVRLLDGSNKPYTGLQVSILGWLGLQIGSAYSACRIANITDETGKGLTDDLIGKAISKFPAGRGATHIICNRDALAMLRDSRTATNATGAPAPFPADAFGVPIITTDAISSTENLETT